MANSILDVFSAIQNGVTGLNNLGKQLNGSMLNIKGQLTNLSSQVTAIQGPWTAYTPTITASAGAFATVSAAGTYFAIGKTVHLTFTITQTAIGTASGQILATYPPIGAPKQNVTLAVSDFSNGTGGFGLAVALGTQVIILRYDGGTLISSGHVLVTTGLYETS